MPSALSEVVDTEWAGVEGRARKVAQTLWRHPEVGLRETTALEVLASWLSDEGFVVQSGVAELPTAFIGSSGGSGGPAVGYLAEYDALPGLSNAAVPKRRPVRVGGPGHGCGHNLIAAANLAAAIALHRGLLLTGRPGKVIVFGTPAEELLLGKLVMHREGVFAEADVLLTSHADYQNAAMARPCAATLSATFRFCGSQGHTAWSTADSAADAAYAMVGLVDKVKSHQLPGVGVECVIDGPSPMVPNVVPEEVRVWCYLRHHDLHRLAEAHQTLLKLAKAAATSADVRLVSKLVAATRGYLPNAVLAETLSACLHRVGPPAWSEMDVARMEAFATFTGDAPTIKSELEVGTVTNGSDPYGQDDGEVSWSRPLGRINWAIPDAVPLHSWAAAALFGTAAAWKGAAMASRALAIAGSEIIAAPEIVESARRELVARRSAEPPAPTMAGAVDVAGW